MKYIDELDKRIKDYFNILEHNFSEWLNDYIETKELLNQRYIDPLENGFRISKSCKIAKKMINKNLNFKTDKYVYLKDISNFLD